MGWWLQSLRISSIPCRGKCDFPGLLSLQSIPSPSTKPTSPQPSSKLFIGGLSYDTNETVLKDAFGAHGDIVEGYGFVQFTSEWEASIALQLMDGQLLDGRNIRVDYANKGTKEIRNVQDKCLKHEAPFAA
ncbi:hypothetical protein MRB53_025001 [Persea americana]|uniref:Uncharacterized protein n=1 Tax=Persea americana TaxID=3435 RepID=A0ACC2LF03_PERAE|nr:hypothetical protein MRB53_025001 [Persea americana]